MERMSCHTSSANATVSGRTFSPSYSPAYSRRAPVLPSRHADFCNSALLESTLGAKLSPKGNKACIGRKTRSDRVQATIAEPPLEVAAETFPRGGQWQVTADSLVKLYLSSNASFFIVLMSC